MTTLVLGGFLSQIEEGGQFNVLANRAIDTGLISALPPIDISSAAVAHPSPLSFMRRAISQRMALNSHTLRGNTFAGTTRLRGDFR
jgi:hypothetical protein